ncbi:hypothetical protein LTR86_000143 [Recurvomyces mirabilis]|nr:hypothetical protein LTR86_000143 [Recurvomyces mirabilis]
MTEAIATTKRKFYKALDSLNNPPATRPTVEPAAKRVRRSTSTASTIPRTQPVPQTTNTAPKQPPNFSPWSHENFLARLKTFSSVSLWHPKPEEISEVAWAKRGWTCVDVNTVACRGGCERRVVVDLELPRKEGTDGGEPGSYGEDQYDDDDALECALVKRYQLLIIDGHSNMCMWRKAGCKDDIYHLQVIRPSIWQPELKQRYVSLLDISDAIRNTSLEKQAGQQEQALPLPIDLLGEDLDQKAYQIAVHGWRGAIDSSNQLLHCDACFQRVGLWMYQPGYRLARSSSDPEDQGTTMLDLNELHREHCPWRNSATQRASGSFSGLNANQVLRRVVATHVREHRRKSKENETNASDEDVEHDANAPARPASPPSPVMSRDEIARQDKDRESRLQKLKSLFTIKRRTTVKRIIPPVAKSK